MSYKSFKVGVARVMKYKQEAVGDEEARKQDQTSREAEEGKSCLLREDLF